MSVPRQTVINDQPHMLAYINPQEAMMLKSMGGAGKPGPGGVPAFYYGFDFGEAGRGKDDNSRDGGDAPQILVMEIKQCLSIMIKALVKQT